MKHTPEPWVIGAMPPNGEVIIGDKKGLMVCIVATGIGTCTLANARRIAACVNACAGMEDPEKELEELRDKIKKLEKQNVKYFAALKELHSTFWVPHQAAVFFNVIEEALKGEV